MVVTRDLVYDELEIATTIVKSAYVDFEEPVIERVKISHARSFWGQIRSLGGRCFELKVSDVFNEIPNEEKAKKRFLGMLVHELLHTIPGCMNHGNKWKTVAERVNRLYPRLSVKRTTDMFEYGIVRKRSDMKYKITCHECGNEFFRRRKTIHTDENYLNTFCRCGMCNARGKFEVIEL